VKFGAVLRTAGDVVDALVAQARLPQLVTNGRSKIHERLVSLRPDDESRSLGHFRPHLEAARLDARADGRNEAGEGPRQAKGPTGRLSFEHPHGGAHDVGDDPAPAGVDGGDVTGVDISYEDGDAVGHAHPNGKALLTVERRGSTDDRVRLRPSGFIRFYRSSAVDLLHLDDPGYPESVVERAIAGGARGKGVQKAHLGEQG
jgi:hypothetical protein